MAENARSHAGYEPALLEHAFVQQIDARRPGKLLAGLGALADAADPEQEEAVRRRAEAATVVAD